MEKNSSGNERQWWYRVHHCESKNSSTSMMALAAAISVVAVSLLTLAVFANSEPD
jgi:hypothetical protein